MASSISTRFHTDPDNQVLVGASPLTGSVFVTLQRGDTDVTLYLNAEQAGKVVRELKDALDEIAIHQRITAEVKALKAEAA